MNNKIIKVSVVIPSRNRLDSLILAIDSIINQKLHNCDIEIVVIDDGSDKPLKQALEKKFDDRVIIIRNESSLGGGTSRRIGVENSSGDYIAFLDDDDYYLENKITDLVSYLECNKNVDAVFGSVIRESKNAAVTSKYLVDNETIKLLNAYLVYIQMVL